MTPISDKANDGSTIVVRPGRPEDIGDLQSIEKGARIRFLALDGFERAASSPAIAAERLLAGETWVVEMEGQLVGFVLIKPMDGTLYLANISVAPSASGRDIGATLLDRVLAHAEEVGAAAVTLATFRTPPWNGPWFRRHGFTPMPESEFGPGLRAILARHAGFLDMRTRETLWRKASQS